MKHLLFKIIQNCSDVELMCLRYSERLNPCACTAFGLQMNCKGSRHRTHRGILLRGED